MLHPNVPSRGDDSIARVAAQAIHCETEVPHDGPGWGVLAVLVALLVSVGVLWASAARDDVRATRQAVEKCR